MEYRDLEPGILGIEMPGNETACHEHAGWDGLTFSVMIYRRRPLADHEKGDAG